MDKIQELERRVKKLEDNKMTKLLSPSDICEMLGISMSTLYHSVRETPDFPQAIRITKQRIGFRESEIEKWINRRQEPKKGEDHPMDKEAEQYLEK